MNTNIYVGSILVLCSVISFIIYPNIIKRCEEKGTPERVSLIKKSLIPYIILPAVIGILIIFFSKG